MSKHETWETLYSDVLDYSKIIGDGFYVYDLADKVNKLAKGRLRGRQHLKSLSKGVEISIMAVE